MCPKRPCIWERASCSRGQAGAQALPLSGWQNVPPSHSAPSALAKLLCRGRRLSWRITGLTQKEQRPVSEPHLAPQQEGREKPSWKLRNPEAGDPPAFLLLRPHLPAQLSCCITRPLLGCWAEVEPTLSRLPSLPSPLGSVSITTPGGGRPC